MSKQSKYIPHIYFYFRSQLPPALICYSLEILLPEKKWEINEKKMVAKKKKKIIDLIYKPQLFLFNSYKLMKCQLI